MCVRVDQARQDRDLSQIDLGLTTLSTGAGRSAGRAKRHNPTSIENDPAIADWRAADGHHPGGSIANHHTAELQKGTIAGKKRFKAGVSPFSQSDSSPDTSGARR